MTTDNTAPYVSLAIICGDAGLATLPRLLTSVLDRADGPMVDEIVLCWNGYLMDTFYRTLARTVLPTIDPENRTVPEHFIVKSVSFRIVRQAWQNDFAKARNESFSHCKGEWILWLDSDDMVASAANVQDSEAIQAARRQYGLPDVTMENAPGMTLKAWLRMLPESVNTVIAPYDYEIDSGGRATIRQAMRRIVRRSAAFTWRSADGIHELLEPTIVPISQVLNLGFLVRHYPGEAADVRSARNNQILLGEDVKATDSPSPTIPSLPENFATDRHAFDYARLYMGRGLWDLADRAIQAAISAARTPDDLYIYHLTRASVAIQRGLINPLALEECFSAVSGSPERQDGYFAAAECFFLIGQWQACVRWFNSGETITPMLEQIDFVYARFTKIRAYVSTALYNLGQYERALGVLEPGLKEFPNDPGCLKAKERTEAKLLEQRAIQAMRDLLSFFKQRNDSRAGDAVAWALHDSVAMRAALPSSEHSALLHKFEAEFDCLDADESDFVKRHPSSEFKCYVSKQMEDVESLLGSGDRQLWNVEQQADDSMLAAYAERWLQDSPKIFFYCPTGIVRWDPHTPSTQGIGGSETSAIYLAKELAARGYQVTMFCPGGERLLKIWDGLLWQGLSEWEFALDKMSENDIIVACRAPWLVRNKNVKAKVWVWHQDNGYGNPWQWSPEVDAATAGSLHVSEWARKGLLKELFDAEPVNAHCSQPHQVIGNGVLPEWCLSELIKNGAKLPERDPRKVIYASDPSRGLNTLLDIWPEVLAACPGATLEVYCDFQASALTGTSLGLLVEIQNKLWKSPATLYKGRVSQPELTRAMLGAGIYAYPGGPMPEGFGVSLVQAAAAGMEVLCPSAGALPEVLGVRSAFKPERLIHYLEHGLSDDARISGSAQMFERHSFSKVADRFELAVGLKKEEEELANVD